MDKQQYAIDQIKAGKNIALMGNAGTGKTYTTKKAKEPNDLVVAPTGIAALNVGGITAHKAFGLPLGVGLPKDIYKVSRKTRNLFEPSSPIKRIFLDEVFVLRRDMFELINAKLQHIRGNKKPWGDLQVIPVGDPFQLEPVLTNSDRMVFENFYDSPFCFDSNFWNFENVILDKVYRQSDKRQVKLLDSIRMKDKHYKKALEIITKESKPYIPSKEVPHLCCFKEDAAKYNEKYFSELDTPVFTYQGHIEGDYKEIDCIVPKNVYLRVGARVIMKANHEEGLYVNGELGTVIELSKWSVKVQKDNGQIIDVEPFKWEKFDYVTMGNELMREVTGSFTQIPIQLAYGISIHSIQGVTLDNATIDIGRGCFSHGQFYVAISRVRNLKNLSFVVDPTPNDVICLPHVKNFYKGVV